MGLYTHSFSLLSTVDVTCSLRFQPPCLPLRIDYKLEMQAKVRKAQLPLLLSGKVLSQQHN